MDITEQLTHESRIALAAAAEITRLRAEVEALRADADDAARYRYVRDLGDPQWFAQLLEQRDNFEVDAAIDAAMAQGDKA